MKGINELAVDHEHTWEILNKWIEDSNHKVSLLSVNREDAEKVLLNLQVTTKSLIGVIAYLTGGVLINDGWLRFLGSGNPNFKRTLSSWNQIDSSGKSTRLSGALMIADDVIGGFFALNGGIFGENIGEVYYLAPDTLEWESMEMSYSDFFKWSLTGHLNKFYESYRWEGWVSEMKDINGDQGVSIYPFLWAEGEEISKRSKKIVPIDELWNITFDFRKQFNIGD